MRLPKFTTHNGDVEDGVPKARLATNRSAQRYDWLADGEAASTHTAGPRLSDAGSPAMGKSLERVAPASHTLASLVATAFTESVLLPLIKVE
jgi:hypothetical protein